MELTPETRVKLLEKRKELRKYLLERTKTASINKKLRQKSTTYKRYADDWVLFSNGNAKLMEEVLVRIDTFLPNKLKLPLSKEKTKITNLITNIARFLGFNIYAYKRSFKILPQKKAKSKLNRQTTSLLVYNVDSNKVLNSLVIKGFCRKSIPGNKLAYRPIAKTAYATLKIEEIINKFNSLIRGNSFGPVSDRVGALNRICYIYYYSCCMTIAKKFNTKTSKIFKRFGQPLTYKIQEKVTLTKTVKRPEMPFYKEKEFQLIDWIQAKEIIEPRRETFKKGYLSPAYNEKVNSDIFVKTINWRTQRNLKCVCAICGKSEKVEMHHVKAIRKDPVEGFIQVMKQLNRKQIPLCQEHHTDGHNGRYSDIKLEDLIEIERFVQ